jgi:hypothetical protein
MGENKGKKFENVIKQCFIKVPNVSIDRVHDQTTRYKGSTNICDFIVYREPYEYYFECKSVHGNTLSIYSTPKPDKNGDLHGFYGNISDRQWEGLLEKSKIQGVFAGVLVWWVDHDVTAFIPISTLQEYRADGHKSVRYDNDDIYRFVLTGKKKRVFFDYDMEVLLNELSATRDA